MLLFLGSSWLLIYLPYALFVGSDFLFLHSFVLAVKALQQSACQGYSDSIHRGKCSRQGVECTEREKSPRFKGEIILANTNFIKCHMGTGKMKKKKRGPER